MAKDAKGHGSERRGGSLSTPDQHQHRIAVDTVRNPMKGLFLGGPSAAEAEQTLRDKFGYSDAHIDLLKSAGNPQPNASDRQAAAALANDHPKSEPVDTHPSMAGGRSVVPRDVAANFAPGGKYGAPSKGFASGQREINRLRKQGK